MLRVSDDGWEGIEGLGDQVLYELRPGAEAAVLTAALYLEGTIKTKLSGARSGRTYQVSRTGRLHVASAPGEPPASLYGNLRNSIGHTSPEWDGWTISSEVGPGLGTRPLGGRGQDPKKYAERLEWGGVHIVPRDVRVYISGAGWRLVKGGTIIRILPRPYMAPSEVEATPAIERMFEGF